MPKKAAAKNDQPKKESAKKRDDDSDDEGDDEDEDDTMTGNSLQPFNLGRSAKHGGFAFLAFILLMSDVFVLRVMGRANMDLVSGRCPTKKGIVVCGLLLALSVIVFDFLITKEIL